MGEEIRPSVIAGSWYPGHKKELQATIEGYFETVSMRPVGGEIIGLISPHAGYIYSGQVAAYGYKQVIGKAFDVVLVVAPLHQMAVGRYVTNRASYYETPLGRIPVDTESLSRLSDAVDLAFVSYDAEHALEIQLPFLQVALEKFFLLPIMVGHGDVRNVSDMVEGLVHVLQGRKALLIASTDLHHIADYDEVVRRDRAVVKALSSFNLTAIRSVLDQHGCSVCGKVPVSIVVETAQRMGGRKLVVLHQTNSGDVTGEKRAGQYTVGYLSAGIVG